MTENERAMHADTSSGDAAGLDFEEASRRLEEIVRKLESGNAGLDEAIALYEEGVGLKKHCERKLAQATARVEKIQPDDDGAPAGLSLLDPEG